jgi:GDP-4-dehydro-6-deoxy-D-mannose reductase
MSSGPILVTGAAGFAGSHLVELLAADSTDLVAWQRHDGPPPTPARARWEAVELLDRRAVEQGIARVRPAVVYHCAGAAHVGRAWDTLEATLATNVRATHHLLEGLRKARLAAIVLMPSSALVYRPREALLREDDPLMPASPYGLSKLAQELTGSHAMADGLDVRIARAFNHIGPRQDAWFAASGFARRIADIETGRWKEPEISVGNLDARREATDVRDTVRAYRAIVERGIRGRPYNVCSGQALAIRTVLEMLLARARVPIQVRLDAERLRPNDVPLLSGDPSRIRDELGWKPDIPLDRTLDDLLEYWRQRAR